MKYPKGHELKTLKDLGSCGYCMECEKSDDGCLKAQIKQEAIKWVKEYRSYIDDYYSNEHIEEVAYHSNTSKNLTINNLRSLAFICFLFRICNL